MRVIAVPVSAIALIAVALAVPATAAPVDKRCVAEVRAAGDWGRTVNPGRYTFIVGTDGHDRIAEVPAGAVFCGLGGNDVIEVNRGRVYGGAGIDTVLHNEGVVDGGLETDIVMVNDGDFYGRGSRDVVDDNRGFFDGGAGVDLVQTSNSGVCVDVEEGC